MGETGTVSRTGVTGFGLSEQEIREGLEVELLRAMRTEGNAPTGSCHCAQHRAHPRGGSHEDGRAAPEGGL